MVGKHLTSQELEDLIKASDNIVFFGGAGMSTESGIPDFRSQHGLYNQKYIYPAEEILSYPFFQEKPDVFYDFYREKIVNCSIKAKPNLGHEQLAKWEKEGKLKAVVTQNIDTLHEQAGSKNVYHLHGKIEDNFCSKCHKYFNLDYITSCQGVARCDACQGVIHPGIVLYGEGLDPSTIESSVQAIEQADILIVGGTSLTVYPAASFINYYRGNKLILINLTDVSRTNVDYFIQGKIGQVLSAVNC